MKPQYEPILPIQKYGYLIEECGEVMHATGKLLRWGEQSVNHELTEDLQVTNRDWLLRELDDLEGAMKRVRDMLEKSKP